MNENFLEKIIHDKKVSNESKSAYFGSLRKSLSQTKYSRYNLFKKMISRPDKLNLIAEIKKASPSKGMLREDFDLLEIARIYVENDAAAISVLTEEKYFLGKPLYVKKVSDAFNVPVLTKDFIINDGQLYEARANGASAVLLIVSILERKQLADFLQLAASLDLDALVEVHNERELEIAIDADSEIIGINNRDLKTFKVDLATSEKLIAKIPKGKVIVVESGIKEHSQVKLIRSWGAHAVLVGEAFMKESDIARKLREVVYGES